MPKINIEKKYKNLKGENIKTGDSKDDPNAEDLTLGRVLSEVVLTPHKDKKGFRPLKGYELAKKFYGESAKNKIVEIDRADFIQIKELVEEGFGWSVLVVAQTLNYLEEANKEK